MSFERFQQTLQDIAKSTDIPGKYWHIFSAFARRYFDLVEKRAAGSVKCEHILLACVEAMVEASKHPQPFQHFHRAERTPIDYYALGLDLFRPLIDRHRSSFMGRDQVKNIDTQIAKKENVFLFSNHQSEADPQLLSLLLEEDFPHLAENMIFVAGERVITDPLAVPFSRGRYLLCIYSKKYFDIHLEKRTQMSDHNKKSIQILAKLLDEGGKCIYIAPSGGRDRPNAEGVFTIAPLDPQSIQLCRLLGQKAQKPTHFYPLALHTHHILPPPEVLQVELGEKRKLCAGPIAAYFGEELSFPSCDHLDKKMQKIEAAEYLCETLNTMYQSLLQKHKNVFPSAS